MSLIHVTYYSEALAGQNDFVLVLPNDVPPFVTEGNPHFLRPMKTLVLLHGYSGCCWDWVSGSRIQDLAGKYHIAVIMPSGRNSFYLDREPTGEKYGVFVGDEVLRYARRTFGLSEKTEDTFIAGLSMGGFGAIHAGLEYSENYSKIASLSGALIIRQLKHMTTEDKNPRGNYAYYTNVFGDLKTAEARNCNPETLVLQKQAAGEKLPDIFMACGTEDFLIEANREFRDFLVAHNVPVRYHEGKGNHDWDFWNAYLEPAILWMLG